MKKLMTVLASAATALFAIGVAKGDGLTTQGTGFEDYSAGAVFDAQKDDQGGTSGNKFWYSTAAAGEIGDISNHVGQVNVSVPDFFAQDSVNANYLHIDASAPLFRSAVANNQSGAFTAVDIGDGIYLDTLVQFTAADDAFQTDLNSGDKIAISYVEHEDDATTTDVNEAWTNFVIRAGAQVEGQFGQENYLAAVPAGFEKDAWHRLTVRTIKDVGDGQVGFVIYLDGDMSKTLNFTNEVNTGFTEASLSTTAKGFYDINALYPSAVNSGTDKATISAASFSGTGALDDVVFTATKPNFIQEAAQVTITWDEGFTAVTIDGTAVTAEELAAKTKTVPLVGGTVLVTYTLASGYEEGAFSSTWDSTLGGFTGLKGGATCELKSLKANFDVGGTHYDKIADAIAAAVEAGTAQSPATIKLLADYAGDIVLNTGNIIIDLAGKTLTGNKTAAIVNNAATIRIINSTVEIGHVVAPAGKPAILLGDEAMVTVEEGWIDGTIILDGDAAITAHLSLIGGKFLDEEYDPTDEGAAFYLKGCVAAGLDVTYADKYFQVGEGGEPSEDWPTGDDLAALAGKKVQDVYTGISADFNKVDAKTFVTWVSGNGDVAYADKGTTTFNINCFLLNIANNSSAEQIAAATATAAEAIKITAITFDEDGKPVITAAESYGNGVVVIEGTISLEDIDWHAKADDDHFFRAKLVVDEVEDPQP